MVSTAASSRLVVGSQVARASSRRSWPSKRLVMSYPLLQIPVPLESGAVHCTKKPLRHDRV